MGMFDRVNFKMNCPNCGRADDDEKRHAAKKELKFLKKLYHKYFVKGVAL